MRKPNAARPDTARKIGTGGQLAGWAYLFQLDSNSR
jgi:hypothetical protein